MTTTDLPTALATMLDAIEDERLYSPSFAMSDDDGKFMFGRIRKQRLIPRTNAHDDDQEKAHDDDQENNGFTAIEWLGWGDTRDEAAKMALEKLSRKPGQQKANAKARPGGRKRVRKGGRVTYSAPKPRKKQ